MSVETIQRIAESRLPADREVSSRNKQKEAVDSNRRFIRGCRLWLLGGGGGAATLYMTVSHEANVLAASVFVQRFSPKDLIYDRSFSTCMTARGTVSDLWAEWMQRAFHLQYYLEKSPYIFDL
jgi:hypothetical protein